jgi:hypothetical protein
MPKQPIRVIGSFLAEWTKKSPAISGALPINVLYNVDYTSFTFTALSPFLPS